MRKASVGANTVRPRGLVLWENCTGAYGIAGSCNDQCPGGALNRTSGPALLAGGHRFARQVLPYGCKIEIAPNLYVGTVGADSISARGVWRMRKTARAHTVRPYTAIKRLPLEGSWLRGSAD